MTPAETLTDVVFKVMLFSRYRVPGKPGEVIEHLSEEYREKLKELKSDSISKIMAELSWYGHTTDQKMRDDDFMSKQKLEFDKIIGI